MTKRDKKLLLWAALAALWLTRSKSAFASDIRDATGNAFIRARDGATFPAPNSAQYYYGDE